MNLTLIGFLSSVWNNPIGYLKGLALGVVVTVVGVWVSKRFNRNR